MKIKNLGMVDYAPTFEAMKQFNDHRTPDTEDELWLVEHPPVFTQGLAGKPEHLLFSGSIPVVQIDRGGQITYHGPGQVVVYTMIDFKRRKPACAPSFPRWKTPSSHPCRIRHRLRQRPRPPWGVCGRAQNRFAWAAD